MSRKNVETSHSRCWVPKAHDTGDDEDGQYSRLERAAWEQSTWESAVRTRLSAGAGGPGHVEVFMRAHGMSDADMDRWCAWFARRLGRDDASGGRRRKTWLGEIDFSENELGSAGIARLLAVLRQSGVRGQVLKLHHNDLEDGRPLAEYIVFSGNVLRELHLSHNRLGTDEAMHVLRAIAATRAEADHDMLPVWLRLEHNFLEPPRLLRGLAALEPKLRGDYAGGAWRRHGGNRPPLLCTAQACSPTYCTWQEAGAPQPAIHSKNLWRQRHTVATSDGAEEKYDALQPVAPQPVKKDEAKDGARRSTDILAKTEEAARTPEKLVKKDVTATSEDKKDVSQSKLQSHMRTREEASVQRKRAEPIIVEEKKRESRTSLRHDGSAHAAAPILAMESYPTLLTASSRAEPDTEGKLGAKEGVRKPIAACKPTWKPKKPTDEDTLDGGCVAAPEVEGKLRTHYPKDVMLWVRKKMGLELEPRRSLIKQVFLPHGDDLTHLVRKESHTRPAVQRPSAPTSKPRQASSKASAKGFVPLIKASPTQSVQSVGHTPSIDQPPAPLKPGPLHPHFAPPTSAGVGEPRRMGDGAYAPFSTGQSVPTPNFVSRRDDHVDVAHLSTSGSLRLRELNERARANMISEARSMPQAPSTSWPLDAQQPPQLHGCRAARPRVLPFNLPEASQRAVPPRDATWCVPRWGQATWAPLQQPAHSNLHHMVRCAGQDKLVGHFAGGFESYQQPRGFSTGSSHGGGYLAPGGMLLQAEQAAYNREAEHAAYYRAAAVAAAATEARRRAEWAVLAPR